jgi:large subunit ribosomal protein L25
MTTNLTFEKRDSKLNPRQIRAAGSIPVTVYGKNIKQSLSLQISLLDFKKLGLSQSVQVINGEVQDEKKPYSLLIKSIERHPVSGEIYNIQFQNVEADQKVKITVPIIYEGTSPLVQAGGTLFINKKSVKLICSSKLIPSVIKFDLTTLQGNFQIAHYSDLPLSEGVLLNSDETQIIAKVTVPQVVAETAKPGK